MQFDCACLCCTVCFQMNSWETSVAFCPVYILVSPPCCYSYYTSQQVHHFHSVFHPLPLSVFFYWVFEPGMGPGAIVKHAFFLPKFCLCVLQPHWGLPSPFPVYSSFVASRKAFISHLFSSSPPPYCSFSPRSPNASLPSEKDRKWMQMSNPPELIAHSLFFSPMRSLFLAFFIFSSSDRPPWLKQLLHHTLNTLTFWTSQWRLSITIATCLFVVSLCCIAVWACTWLWCYSTQAGKL